MRSPHRVDIKRIIDDLGRQALELQKHRLALIEEIRADPSYEQDILNAPPAAEGYWGYQNDLAFYQPRHYHPNQKVIDLIQRVLVVEASLLRIREKTAELDALITPILVLPDEVLGVMFEVASRPESEPSKSSYISWDSERRVPLPIILASVCRRWRHVALSKSTLWTNIYLTPWRPRSWTELFLTRSSSHLLDVTIDFCTNFSPKAEALDDMANLVLPRVELWRSLTVVTHHKDVLSYLGARFRDLCTPELSSLRLSLTGSGPPGNQVVSLSPLFQGGAPSLTRLHVDSVALDWLSRPFQGLSVLDLRWLWNDTKLSYRQFRDLLSASPNLTSLVLRGLYVELIPGLAYPVIQAPSLSSLELSGDNVSCMMSLLDTPLLEDLFLANVDEAEFLDLMRSFDLPARRHYPRLQSLHLLNVVTTPHMECFFASIPNLTMLSIVHSSVTRFFHLLSPQPQSADVYLPRLQTLTLLDDVNEKALLGMIRNRAAVGHPLQRLKVHAGAVDAQHAALFAEHVKFDGVYFRDRSR